MGRAPRTAGPIGTQKKSPFQRRSGCLDPEDKSERLVERSQFVCVEPSGGPPQTLRVDDRRLFDKNPCLAPVERDGRPEACGEGASRGGCDKRRREIQELIGLHDHRVPASTLLVPTGASWGRQVEHLATDHLSVGPPWRKLSHLLADDSHLLTVGFVGRNTPHLVSKGRADSTARRSLPQRGAYGLRVAHAAGADDIEGGGGDVVEADMQGSSHAQPL